MVVKEYVWHNPLVIWRSRAAKVLTIAAIAVALAGCYWLRYHDLVITHAELLEDLSAATLPQLETAPGEISPGDVERLRYPLERARQFTEIANKRYPGDPELLELEALMGVYSGLLVELDRLRAGNGDPIAAIASIGAIADSAARVRAAVALAREEG